MKLIRRKYISISEVISLSYTSQANVCMHSMHCPMMSWADACSSCMGSVVLILSQIYLYSINFEVICKSSASGTMLPSGGKNWQLIYPRYELLYSFKWCTLSASKIASINLMLSNLSCNRKFLKETDVPIETIIAYT
jgi:hypothetical protein